MAPILPLRLLGHDNGEFFVFDPRSRQGEKAPRHDCGIRGVTWGVTISQEKLEDIKRLMIETPIQYMWADCVCINQEHQTEKSDEVARMYEYYSSAKRCHILLDMEETWEPQLIVDNPHFINHVVSQIDGAAMASESMLTDNITNNLSRWANSKWNFPMHKLAVKSAAVDLGVLNCYATCILHVRSLFENLYFTRVWTFQEMLLGKNVTIWGINTRGISSIGALDAWIDLATEAKDKGYKLQQWIGNPRFFRTSSVTAILSIIEEDNLALRALQAQVDGISAARTDILNGGHYWWYENYKGVCNVFSAISIQPRECTEWVDIFRGLLGVFCGLFTQEEIQTYMKGDDMETVSFAFFKQLSIKTGQGWTRLAISSRERGKWDWIPVAASNSRLMTTDCFAGVVKLGPVDQKNGLLRQEDRGFHFVFRGCNCDKTVKTGTFKKEKIPLNDRPKGRGRRRDRQNTGAMYDHPRKYHGPGDNLVEYRRRLLRKLQPMWHYDRCVSGTPWENPYPAYIRAQNHSMNYSMGDRIISCEVRAVCGCTIITPLPFLIAAITAVHGSSLGDTFAGVDSDKRIVLRDGLWLIQVGDVGEAFHLVAFRGDVRAYKSHAPDCRSTAVDLPVYHNRDLWLKGRALVRADFRHDATDMMRDYGYVETGGSGNLLIRRSHPLDKDRIVGVCIDGYMETKDGGMGRKTVTVQ
ncbi:uncharacterized protein B0T15DRAFT_558658 [Chaetomium strumarium]|uniref:Heterokaryon incompatibility domain-containing protein n=1 Tax=Chaetomium strumarium TaxID=1170767 RepID=A0AAJ0GRC7_9PEZI|nr:hypothetical protein B0T15DRAFT_558658 [Chaetomium strumarium]